MVIFMKIAIRLDDITQHMNWKNFNKFKALLDENGIKPLVGIVPDNQDDNLCFKEENIQYSLIFSGEEKFWNYIKELQDSGWVIAQHGYSHVYSRKKGGMFPLNRFSEFAGVPFEDQRNMIMKGKKILQSYGIATDIFMAPAHSYDKNTLNALKQAGFSKITDGFGRSPYKWQDMTFYPIAYRLESSLRKDKGYTTMVVHTNTMTDEDFKRYRRIISEGNVISYGDYLKETAAERGITGRAWEYIMAGLKRVLVRFI